MAVPFEYLEVGGSHREIGRQIGEGARMQIERCVAAYEGDFEHLTGMSLAAAEAKVRPLLAAAERALPQYVDELHGLAEGSGVPFWRLLLLNCGEELLCATGAEGGHCTSVAMVADGRTVVAHNEDWTENDIQNNVLLRITVPDGTRILAMTTACFLAMTGLNSHGLAFGANTLYAHDERRGVPNSFVCRSVLESATRDEATARALLATRARGSNFLFGRAGGTIWDVETSAEAATVIEGDEWLVHTNHYVADEMRAVGDPPSEGSGHRYARACELVAAGLRSGVDTVTLASTVLRDHDGAPASICGHGVLGEDDPSPTTASMIWELEERCMHVCAGPPCENLYRIVRLD